MIAASNDSDHTQRACAAPLLYDGCAVRRRRSVFRRTKPGLYSINSIFGRRRLTEDLMVLMTANSTSTALRTPFFRRHQNVSDGAPPHDSLSRQVTFFLGGSGAVRNKLHRGIFHVLRSTLLRQDEQSYSGTRYIPTHRGLNLLNAVATLIATCHFGRGYCRQEVPCIKLGNGRVEPQRTQAQRT